MAFEEVRFPTDISYGSSGGPEYSTDIVEISSGFEQRNSNWQQARARYNVAHGVKNQAQLDALIAFFRARKGAAKGFRFKDWSDFQATGQQLGIGDGSQTDFQLIKNYASGSVIETRDIAKPVASTVNIYIDGSLQTSGFSVDSATGFVTFDSAPALTEVVTADFEFDVPVRFDTDRLSASLDQYGSQSWADIPLIEIRSE